LPMPVLMIQILLGLVNSRQNLIESFQLVVGKPHPIRGWLVSSWDFLIQEAQFYELGAGLQVHVHVYLNVITGTMKRETG